MARITGFTDGLQELELERLIAIYEKAELAIRSAIQNSNNLDKRQEKEFLLKQIKTILTDLYDPTAKFMAQGVQTQKDIGTQEVQEVLKQPNLDQDFSLINEQAVKFITSNFDDIEILAFEQVKQSLSYSFEQIKSLFNTSITQYKTQILTDIASGQIQGKGTKALTKVILDNLEAKGVRSTNNRSLKSVIKTTVQHTLINSRMSSVVQSALTAGLDLVKISNHKNPSPMCDPFQGNIVSITGQTKGFDTLSEVLFIGKYIYGGGILHPNCRHSLTIYIKTNVKFN